MGGGTSKLEISINVTEASTLLMPNYYIKNVEVTDDDVNFARNSWTKIRLDTAPNFLMKKNSLDNDTTCLIWFSEVFYERLFEVSPPSRPLFKNNLQRQGKMLVGLITTSLGLLNSIDKLVPTLIDLASRHTKYGVVASQYGTLGDVLFWTLRHCLGEDSFNNDTATAWVKIYS